MTAPAKVWRLFACLLPLTSLWPGVQEKDAAMPAFGRDTVLVYKSSNESEAPFVVRVAEFAPDRYVEWEDATTQGTIFMPSKAITLAKGFVNWRLYEGGVDTKGKDATTLWLSRRLFRDLKEKQKVKVDMDGIPTWITLIGSDRMLLEVNRVAREVPVIKTKDERSAERWFLDLEDNALLVNAIYRNYQQKLASVTTDRHNTLRWIKDKKK